jgi:hypothetical protein
MLYREIIAVCSEIHTKHVRNRRIYNEEFWGTFAKFLPVCPSARNNSARTERIFMKFDISLFFENPSRKFKFR